MPVLIYNVLGKLIGGRIIQRLKGVSLGDLLFAFLDSVWAGAALKLWLTFFLFNVK